MTAYEYILNRKLNSRADVTKAEDWLRRNMPRGTWGLEFVGVADEEDAKSGRRVSKILIRFKFGQKENLLRFKTEYFEKRKYDPKEHEDPKDAKANTEGKKKGILAKIFGG
ncbi:MAG: hypothetical protein EXQ89_02560 [Rhodospirillaceae bacterium]|nr:hypothetical protein [Rhodospirillaceae bacterium]